MLRNELAESMLQQTQPLDTQRAINSLSNTDRSIMQNPTNAPYSASGKLRTNQVMASPGSAASLSQTNQLLDIQQQMQDVTNLSRLSRIADATGNSAGYTSYRRSINDGRGANARFGLPGAYGFESGGSVDMDEIDRKYGLSTKKPAPTPAPEAQQPAPQPAPAAPAKKPGVVDSIKGFFGGKQKKALSDLTAAGYADGGAVNPLNDLRSGGPVQGRGGPTQDNVPVIAPDGGYMLPAKTVAALGGIAAIKGLLGYAKGGQVGGVPIMGSNGEYMLNPAHVDALGGKAFLDRLVKATNGKDPGGSPIEMANGGGIAGARTDLTYDEIMAGEEAKPPARQPNVAVSAPQSGGGWSLGASGAPNTGALPADVIEAGKAKMREQLNRAAAAAPAAAPQKAAPAPAATATAKQNPANAIVDTSSGETTIDSVGNAYTPERGYNPFGAVVDMFADSATAARTGTRYSDLQKDRAAGTIPSDDERIQSRLPVRNDPAKVSKEAAATAAATAAASAPPATEQPEEVANPLADIQARSERHQALVDSGQRQAANRGVSIPTAIATDAGVRNTFNSAHEQSGTGIRYGTTTGADGKPQMMISGGVADKPQYVGADGKATNDWTQTQQFKDGTALAAKEKQLVASMQAEREGRDREALISRLASSGDRNMVEGAKALAGMKAYNPLDSLLAAQQAGETQATAKVDRATKEQALGRAKKLDDLITQASNEPNQAKRTQLLESALAMQGKDMKDARYIKVDGGEYIGPDGMTKMKKPSGVFDTATKTFIPMDGAGAGAGAAKPTRGEVDAAIKAGADKKAVAERLKQAGFDPKEYGL